MRNGMLLSAILFFTALAIFPAASAQTGDQSKMGAAGAQAPIQTHDLSGVWNAERSAYPFASFGMNVPMTPWGLAQFNAAKPSQGPHGVTLKETNDMVYQCYSPGMPYIYLQVFPMQIVQTPNELIELFEYDHSVRHIYLDRSTHPADLTPTYMGDSIGHWEGDTLVVDTVGLNDKRWLDRVGHPTSDQMHIIERIRRTDANTLQVDLTFDDPKAYTKPWTATMRWGLHPTWHIMEDMCMDNKTFESFEK